MFVQKLTLYSSQTPRLCYPSFIRSYCSKFTPTHQHTHNNPTPPTFSSPARSPSSRPTPASYSTISTTQISEMAGKYIDTHTHVDHTLHKLKMQLEDYPKFAKEYYPPELEAIVNVCCDFESFDPTEKLVENEMVYAAYGIHPHNAKDYTDEIEQRIIRNMSHPKTVAWGEIGLDYHYNMSPPEAQKTVFARQLVKAVELKKPIVIHTREAEEDTFRILKENVPVDWRLHIHCFTSSVQLAKNILDYFPNSFIGFTGVVTFKNSHDIRAVVTQVPVDRILLETDGPFMAPEPYRGRPAHSGHIPYIAKKIAEVKGVSADDMLAAARENTRKMYGI